MQINLTHKSLKFKKPARTSRGEYAEHNMIIVSITDDEGKTMGIGECAPLPDLSCDRDAYTRMSDVADLINRALASDDYTEFLRPYPALLFALESAMYDYTKSPVLYDTPFAKGEVGIPINGLVWMSSYDDMLQQIKDKIMQGFRCIKLKIGAIEWEKEMELIRFIRSKFSKDRLELRVDANGSLVPDVSDEEDNASISDSDDYLYRVKQRLEELARYDIHSIEQPIRPLWHESGRVKSWKDMAELCRFAAEGNGIPIALDEELIGVNNIEEKRILLDTIRPQYIVIKPTLHGGISGSLEWIHEAQSRGIKSWITSALESNIGLHSVALLTACAYGPDITFPQGLGTGQLFVNNIDIDDELVIEKGRIRIKR